MDLRDESVVALAARVRARELGARELARHCLDRIEAHDGQLNCFVALDGERALAEAAAIDERLARGEDVGPLAGIPIGVKDLEAAAGFVTTHGSHLHTDDAPAEEDSVEVARLRAAGCVVLGKTNTPENGWKGDTTSPPFGATRNPWNLERSPGGSSGGSGAAIAAGLVPLATGSDGGGSIRIPSALCGLSGCKPSQGRVPAESTDRAPGSGQLAVRGPMALRIRDVAAALDVVVGPHPLDPFSLPRDAGSWSAAVAGPVGPPARVVWSPAMAGPVDAEIARVTGEAVAAMAGLGTEVVEVDAVFREDPTWPWFTMWCIYAFRTLGEQRDTDRWELIDEGLREQVVFGSTLGPDDFVRALDAVYRAHADVERVLADHDATLLVSPTTAGQTGRSGANGTIDGVEDVNWVRFTYPFNMTRHPAATVCAGLTGDGMPVGLQLVGGHLDDVGVLRGAAALEDLLGGAHRRAPFPVG
ncbi:MAG: hypothetical protein KDB35_07685 [Acidimicrobiales bacterium]|nr:hypothetical protein [Acidimicrobiales bacterium]